MCIRDRDKATWLDLPVRYQPYTRVKEKLLRLFLP